MKNVCYGCDDGVRTPLQEDHMHQHINMRGDATTCWWISGNVYVSMEAARSAVEKEYECSVKDAYDYIRKITKKYS